MAKILDLRKKTTPPKRVSPVPQKHKEEIGIKENPHISWEAPSFYYNPQKRYLSLTIIALLVGAIALLVFRYDTLTSIFMIVASLVLILYGKQKPIASKIKIDQSGILVDDRMYYYKDLKSFWIDYNPGGPREFSIESMKWYMPYIKVLLNEQNPIEVRSLVINFLPEQEHENSLADHIGRKLGL